MDKHNYMKVKGRYSEGYRYCTRCRTFYPTDSIRCPICGIILRKSPRKKRYVEKRAIEVPPHLEEELDRVDLKIILINDRG